MKKEFVFSAKFDTSEFDKSIELMQQKLKNAMAPASMAQMQQATSQRLGQAGFGGLMSAPSMEAFTRATQQSRREMDQFIAEQAKGQEKLGKIIAQRTEMLKKLQSQQKDIVRDSEEELKIKEKISRVEANNQQLREQYVQRNATLNQAIGARESLRPRGMAGIAEGYQQGGIGGAFRSGMGMLNRSNVGAGIAGLGWLAREGADMYRDFSAGPIRTEAAMGNAVQGSLGRDAANIYGRRTGFEQNFSPERSRAARMALEKMQADRTADKVALGGNLAMIGGGAAAIGVGGSQGAALGAAAGSAVPGLGTAAGGIGGGILGAMPGILAAGKGMMGLFGDERQRSLALSPFMNSADNRYQSMLSEDLSKNYESTYEAQKRQNPFKTAAIGEYEQNWQRNLGAQRSMGMNNEAFYGNNGYLRSGMDAGFTPEMSLEMSQGILASGGSTRSAAGNSVLGNQLSRNMNLTNSSQILGSLSGSLGSSESTKQATIKILAEGMKLGLDDSKFAEESRKFTAMTAEIVARSGAKSDADIERVSGGVGRFLGENTSRGIEGAKSAYEEYQNISSQTSGPRGVMRAAGFMADKDLNRMSTMTKQALMQVPESDLNEGNPLVQAAMKETGLSAQELISKVSGINQGATSRFKESDTIRDRLRAGMKSMGKERLSESDISSLPQGMRDDLNKLSTFQTTEMGYKNSQTTMARALGAINGTGTDEMKQITRENLSSDRLGRTDTGRMEDSTIQSMASDSKVVLDNFNEMAPAMETAAKTTAAWTRQVREMNAELTQALENARNNKGSDTLKALEDIMKRNAASGTQTQSGRQSK